MTTNSQNSFREWPKTITLADQDRTIDKATYDRLQVKLTAGELVIVGQLTAGQTHDEWTRKVRAASGSRSIDNPTAMLWDEGYRKLGDDLRFQAGCDEARSWRIKTYVRECWVSGAQNCTISLDLSKLSILRPLATA